MGKLSNKIALVTGGNSGIGLATAKLFLEEGAKVIITARSKETYEKAKKELGEEFDLVQTDVSKVEDLDRLYQHIKTRYGKFDVLFANAGIAGFRNVSEVTPEFFDSHFDTNVRGLFFTVQKAIPLLNPGSTVVLNASSMNVKGFAGSSVYGATKAAVRHFARTWTAEIPVDQIRFNVVSPGPVETPIFDKLGLQNEQKEGMISGITAGVPMKRIGRPEELAKAVLFLASSDSSYVAGAELFVDGGLSQI